MENEQLHLTNQQLQMKCDEFQQQMNKLVEENVKLRTGQPRTPTTPTSPLPVIMEPVAEAEENREEEGEGEEGAMDVYAQVDMSKVCGLVV